MALPFSDLPTLLDQAHRSDTESEQSSHPEQSGVNPLLDNINDITSLVQSADLARKLTADPLVTDLWRLYTKGQHHIPQAKRFENLMWRRMAIKLVCPKAGSASSESNLSTPTDYSVPERESITIPVDGAPVAKFQISPIRDTKNTSSHHTPLKPAPQNYSKPEPTSRPEIALKNESSGGTVGHTEGNNAQYSASGVSYPYDITTMMNDINNSVEQNNAGLAHLAPNPAPQIYMPAQNYYNPNYAPNQYTSFGRGGGSGDGGGGDDVGGFENLNNGFSTNSQAWYDPTYANFSSMLNRNWVNLNGIPAPNGDVSPFNHSTFVDYVAVNQPPVRRSRTALELGLLNQADSNTLSYLTDSLQSAQASRIRELEQQITLLLADRPPNRFAYHPSASTAAPLVVPNPTNYPPGTLGTYAPVNNLFATDSISMAPVQNYQVKVDNQPRSIIPGPEPASNLRPEYSRSSSLGNYFPTQQQAPDSYCPAVSTSKANSAKLSQLQAKPSEPQSAFSVNVLAEYRTSPPANQSAQIKQSSNEYSESHRPARPPRPSSDSGKESGGEAPRMVCDNCGVSKTSLWRRSSSGAPLCNACGLFSKLHGKERPLSMKTEVIRKRNRGPAGGRNNGARKRAKTPDP